MQQNGNIDNNIFESWESDYKQHFYINERGEIILMNKALNREYKLGALKDYDLNEGVQKCLDSYLSLQQQFQNTQAKWESTADKLTVRKDIFDLKQNINRTPAIGDWGHIISFLDNAETEIKNHFDHNKKIKESIVNQAQKLSSSTDWKETSELFKALQEEWKNSPEVTKNDYDDLYNQFNEYKNTFFNKRNEILETEHMVNWDKKIDICERAESLQNSSDWKATTDLFKSLFEEWKTIGNVTSHEKNEELWNRFNNARQAFYDRKNAHSDQIKIEQSENLNKKLALIEEAEALSTSTQWKETHDRLEQLQIQWDAIGRVPQDRSDEIWGRWRQAKDTFYEAKKKFNKDYLQTLNENYNKKLELTQKAETIAQSKQWKQATEELSQLLDIWKTIGPIPREYGDELWIRFNDARRLFFQRKDEDREIRKSQFEEKSKTRIQQTENFLKILKEENEADLQQLQEFQLNLENIDGQNKRDAEIKDLNINLINNLKKQIEKRNKKIENVQQQLDELRQI